MLPVYQIPRIRLVLAVVFCVLTILLLWRHGAIPQPLEYHHFADRRPFFFIQNGLDVLTNFGFLLVAVMALYKLWHRPTFGHPNRLRIHDYCFFTAILFVSLGSAYYHLEPNNASLFWDRLAISMAFMCLLSIILAEQISMRYSRTVLLFNLFLGIVSVVYWHSTEQLGNGDLRPYIMVQFLSIIIVLLLIIPDATKRNTRYLWAMLIFYFFAKITESLDTFIFQLTAEIISGHSLKHIFSALAAYCYLQRCQYYQHPTY